MAISNPCGTQPLAVNPSISSSIALAVSQLQVNWHILPDFDRAQAVLPIIKAGMSRRTLAKELQVSEATIRLLLAILEADRTDQIAFRHGAISRNELVRRVKGTSTRDETPSPDHGEPDSAFKGGPAELCREILAWLAADPRRASNASLILRLAIIRIKDAIAAGTLLRPPYLTDAPIEEIIRRCRPDLTRQSVPVIWHADWALAWVFHLIPNPRLCWDALNMAPRPGSDRCQPAGPLVVPPASPR